MPSALEKLVKILRLEQETGYKNTAVIGGLQSFGNNWTVEAHQQAKTNEHHALVEELAKVIDYYGTLEDHETRYNTVRYMLGRITGRVEPQPEFVVEWTDEHTTQLPSAEPEPDQKYERNEIKHGDQELSAVQVTDDEGVEDNDVGDVVAEYLEVDAIVSSGTYSPRERAPKPRRLQRVDVPPDEALSQWNRLNDPVNSLKGVGGRRAEQLANLGIQTVGDLLFLFPRRYDDYTRVLPLGKLVPMEKVSALGTITDITERVTRDNRRYLRVTLEDQTGKLPVTFFGQTHLKRYFRAGMQIAVNGKVELYLGQPQMSNPDWEPVDDDDLYTGAIVPIYPLTKGLSNKVLRNLIEQAIEDYAQTLPDYVPLSVLERTELVDLIWALEQVHFPQRVEFIEYAQERLAFDELMLLQLGVLSKRREWQAVAGIPLPIDHGWVESFANKLPFNLTSAQQRAIEAIRTDVASEIPMNRLLQGDVGSGKTVVAAMALGMAVANGKQAAIMAPTSILAEQHFQSLCNLLEDMPGKDEIYICLLTGATPESERREIYEGLANGKVDVLVGTHALIQERVEFHNLALAVIDEQHRFGVNERGSLRGKGTNPHILVMTATPIPRTLALTLFADLDLTVLDEMPPGRTPIETKVIHPAEREQAYNFIRKKLDEGRQAYIVYPLVESSENVQAKAAVDSFEELSASDFYEYRMGLLHGRINPAEKDDIMAAFAAHELDVLVSTSVIEVGINVPNASVIMIEGANRFGLAQLHQLRGRVGRGEHQSYCLLLADSMNEDASRRLEAVESTTDGFELAQLDWEMRGPGDLLGTRQAGVGAVELASMINVQLVEIAQIESKSLFEEDPYLNLPEHQLLAARVDALQKRNTDFS